MLTLNSMAAGPSMGKIFSLIEDIADLKSNILITGESGTGKSLLADILHSSSARRDGPFLKVHCSYLQDGPESDFFRQASKGTLFLDEIGDLNAVMQRKLLTILSEKTDQDVRIISSTNQKLEEKLLDGSFRMDLYYRLKVIEIKLSPLRNRKEDIPFLTDHFMGKLRRDRGKDVISLSKEVEKIFMDYFWPGNVRELENVLEYAFVMNKSSVIAQEDLPPEFASPDFMIKNSETAEKNSILNLLEKTRWNKARTARLLGMSRPTLYKKMGYYGIAE